MANNHPSDADPLSISVVICAYTEMRWDSIVESVNSVLKQTAPADEVVVVVDHNPALVSRCLKELPGVIVVANTELPGLAGARNTGIARSSGSIIAFLDDDARAEPDWLTRLLPHYADATVLGVGGGITPEWGGPRPSHYPREFDWVVGCSYIGLPTGPSHVRNVIGANMSIRRAVFDTVGGFAQDLGRIRSRPAGCEETELCIRALARMHNSCFVYEPAAVVHHRVGPERQTWAYFRSRCFSEGRSKAVVAGLVGAGAGLAAERTYVRHVLPYGVRRGLRDFLLGDATGLVRAGWILAGLSFTTAGYLAGGVSASRGRRKAQPIAYAAASGADVATPVSSMVINQENAS